MELIILKIILIILIIRIIGLMIEHLIIVFSDKDIEKEVNNIMKNPYERARSDHMNKFFNNMLWLYIFIRLIIGIYNGNILFN